MADIRIGVQLSSLRLPFQKALYTAASLGAQAVEIDARNELRPRDLSETGARQIRKLMSDFNLKVCAVRFATKRSYDDPEHLDARVEATKDAMTLARRLGCEFVINQLGGCLASEMDDDALAVSPPYGHLLGVLSDLGRFGQHSGAMLLAETGSEPPERLKKLLSELPESSIGVDFNPGQLIVNGFSSTDAVRELGRDIMHVHTVDAVRDLARGRGLEVQLGRGSVDFPNLLGLLEEWGYRGFFTVQRSGDGNPIRVVADAIEYLKNV